MKKANQADNFDEQKDSLLNALASYAPTLESLTEEIVSTWPDVYAHIQTALNVSEHPETRGTYETIALREQTIVNNIMEATSETQKLIETFRAGNYTGRLRRIIESLANADPHRLADDDTLKKAKEASDKLFTLPASAASIVAIAYLPLYSIPRLHRDTLAAYLGRPTTGKRMAQAAWEIILAATSDQVPFLGLAITALEQLEPLIERELRALPEQVHHQDRVLHLRDALKHILRLSQIAKLVARNAVTELNELNSDFHASASRLTNILEKTA